MGHGLSLSDGLSWGDSILSVGSLFYDRTAYNQAGFANNAALDQAQTYQKQNYQIQWLTSVREELRDMMQIFVGRMANNMVVDTVIISIAGGFLCGAQVADSCPDFVANAMYLGFGISVVYMITAMMLATHGGTIAYTSSKDFLVAVVPYDQHQYNIDYKKWTTERFEDSQERWMRSHLYNMLKSMVTSTKNASEDDCPLKPIAHMRPSFFDRLREYSELWEPFAIESQIMTASGVASLLQGASYFFLGKMFDSRIARGGAYVMMFLCVFLAVAFLCSYRHMTRLPQAADTNRPQDDVEAAHLQIENSIDMLWEILSGPRAAGFDRLQDDVEAPHLQIEHPSDMSGKSFQSGCEKSDIWLLCLLLAPLSCLFAVVVNNPWAQIFFVSLCYLFQAIFPFLILLAIIRAHFHREGIARGEDESSANSLDTTATTGSISPLEEVSQQTHACSTSFDRDLEMMMTKSKNRIKSTRLTVFRSMCFSHAVSSLAWFVLMCWSLGAFSLPFVFPSRYIMPSTASVETLPATWPSPIFQPRSMGCGAGGRAVFVADDYRVFEWTSDGVMRPVACSLGRPILDVAAECDGSDCWPLVLTQGEVPEVVNCSSGHTHQFIQAVGPTTHLAADDTFIFASQAGALTEHVREASRFIDGYLRPGGLRPSQRLAAMPPGSAVRSVDVATTASGLRRLFVFRGDEQRRTASVEVRELPSATAAAAAPHEAGSALWRLPSGLPALVGGCAEADGASALAILQDQAPNVEADGMVLTRIARQAHLVRLRTPQ